MGVTEEHLLGEVLVDEGRIRFRLFDQLVLFQRPFLRQRRADWQDEECRGEGEQIVGFTVHYRFCTHINSPNYGPDLDARST